MRLIAQGAEAKIYLDGKKVIKHRIKKNYRINQIDETVRKRTTRREIKILKKASSIIAVPELLNWSEEEMKVEMGFIAGKQLKEVIDGMEQCKRVSIFEEVGRQTARLHNNDIIHGDLTTSNMILKDNKIFFIDFGLGFFSQKIEDKAVDIHLFKQALNSRHFMHGEESFDAFLKGYSKESRHFDPVIQRFIKVEERGRYKTKGGN